MGCGTCCLKCLLILFNTLFGLIGLVLLAAGALVFGAANKYISPILDSALSALPGIMGSFNLKDATQVQAGDLKLDIVAILKPVAIFLIIFGLILIICAIFGSCGSCCSNRIMLIVYAGIVLVMLLIQIIIVALFFSGTLDSTIKTKMKATITNEFVALDDTGMWSVAWNVLQIHYKCCGVDDYNDYKGAKKWKDTRKMTILGAEVDVKLVTPFTCCKFTGTFPNSQPIDQTCNITPTDFTNNWKQGCYEPMLDALDGIYTILIGAIAGMLVFQFLCAVAAIVIAMYIQKEKNDMA